jgi:hypothetical protein
MTMNWRRTRIGCRDLEGIDIADEDRQDVFCPGRAVNQRRVLSIDPLEVLGQGQIDCFRRRWDWRHRLLGL